jgi:hypothetical protein
MECLTNIINIHFSFRYNEATELHAYKPMHYTCLTKFAQHTLSLELKIKSDARFVFSIEHTNYNDAHYMLVRNEHTAFGGMPTRRTAIGSSSKRAHLRQGKRRGVEPRQPTTSTARACRAAVHPCRGDEDEAP